MPMNPTETLRGRAWERQAERERQAGILLLVWKTPDENTIEKEKVFILLLSARNLNVHFSFIRFLFFSFFNIFLLVFVPLWGPLVLSTFTNETFTGKDFSHLLLPTQFKGIFILCIAVHFVADKFYAGISNKHIFIS